MKQIRIDGIPGHYYIEDGYLLYSINGNEPIQVSDLSDLTIYQYNQLAMSINAAYPNYNIDILKGQFI